MQLTVNGALRSANELNIQKRLSSDGEANLSWPGLSRPSTSCFLAKMWMPGTRRTRPGMTAEFASPKVETALAIRSSPLRAASSGPPNVRRDRFCGSGARFRSCIGSAGRSQANTFSMRRAAFALRDRCVGLLPYPFLPSSRSVFSPMPVASKPPSTAITCPVM